MSPNRFHPFLGFTRQTVLGFGLTFILAACSNSKKMYVPDDMPDVCQDLDFNRDKGLRNVCGVRSHDYLAYRNIPEHRNLKEPKAGVIIQKGDVLQLRLENFLPIDLPKEFQGKLHFGEGVRRDIVKSKMMYVEYFRPNAERPERLIRLDIPMDDSTTQSVCYSVERKTETQQRKTGSAGKLNNLSCEDFNQLKLEADKAQ